MGDEGFQEMEMGRRNEVLRNSPCEKAGRTTGESKSVAGLRERRCPACWFERRAETNFVASSRWTEASSKPLGTAQTRFVTTSRREREQERLSRNSPPTPAAA